VPQPAESVEPGLALPRAGWRAPGYARIATLDASSRVRLAGLPSPTTWLPEISHLPGVVWLRRLPTDAATVDECLHLDENGRLRLTENVRDWLTIDVHLPAANPAVAGSTTPLHQIVVVAAS
jgi:hypothetical protein